MTQDQINQLRGKLTDLLVQHGLQNNNAANEIFAIMLMNDEDQATVADAQKLTVISNLETQAAEYENVAAARRKQVNELRGSSR